MFKDIKNNHIFLFSLLLAFLFWFVESLLHAHFFDEEMHFEIVPHDANELWMRAVITFLIPLIGFLAGRYIQLQKKIQEEKLRTLEASMISMNEVVGNTLSLMHHYCDDFIKSGKAEIDSVKSMKEIIEDTFVALEHLKDINNMVEQEKHQDNVRKH